MVQSLYKRDSQFEFIMSDEEDYREATVSKNIAPRKKCYSRIEDIKNKRITDILDDNSFQRDFYVKVKYRQKRFEIYMEEASREEDLNLKPDNYKN